MVAVRSRVFATDEELAKRDDDRRPAKMSHWSIKHKPAWRKRRIFFILVACVGVWLFIHYIPTDLGPVDRHTGRRLPNPRAPPPPPTRPAFENVRKPPDSSPPPPPPQQPQQPQPPPPAQAPLQDDGPAGPPPRDYDGPIHFYYLASTLRAAQRAKDIEDEDHDVLFAASNLNSAGAIIPMACEMAGWKRNIVHMAILGRSEIPLEDIKTMNGVPGAACDIRWHDARPDFVPTSTDARMEVSIAGALGHIDNFVHPVAVITTDLDSEDIIFALGMDRKLKQLDLTHIEVPKERPESLSWAARLDAAALRAWHTASIDVLVQAPLDSSGSLIRLLKSMTVADYSGFSPPRLTVELPHIIDDATMNFLGRFRWPPPRYASLGQNNQLTIRRRIFEHRLSVDDASQRFIESFYPSSLKGPHVLLLSPQVELSPVYFHYLKLNVLEHRHSSNIGGVERRLFGISLESPSVHLDGVKPFEPPLTSTPPAESNGQAQPSPFRWQAPNSNAVLYFGDKWMELHSFLMKRHSAARRPDLQSHYRSEQKIVSAKSPAWVEYFLQLMRSRAYFVQYPSLKSSPALAIVHNELFQLPEEFARVEDDSKPKREPPSSETVLTVKDDYLDSHHPLASRPKVLNAEGLLVQDLNRILPTLPRPIRKATGGNADTPEMNPIGPAGEKSLPAMQRLSTLPLLDYLGQSVTLDSLDGNAESVRASFRTSAGGCTAQQSKKKQAVPGSAEDLFCFTDSVEDDFEPISFPSQLTGQLSALDNVAKPPAAEIPLGPAAGQDTPPPKADNIPISDGAAAANDIGAEKPLQPQVQRDPPQPNVETVPVNNDPAVAAPPPGDNAAAAEAERLRENHKKLEAAARIPGTPDPLDNPAATGPQQPGPGVEAELGPGPPPSSDTPGSNRFPVLDSSKIKAFDEGREAERDVPVVARDGTNTDAKDGVAP